MSDSTWWQAAEILDGNGIDLSALHVGLHTASPGRGGSLAAELSGHGYARMDIAALISGITAEGVIVLISPLTFPDPTGSGGTVTHVSLNTASSAGNMRALKALAAPYVWQIGEPPLTFPAAGLSWAF